MHILRLATEHLVPSMIIGIIGYLLSKDINVFFVSLGLGWLIDIDHTIDFFIAIKKGMKKKLFFIEIFKVEYFNYNGKIIILFHSWEFLFLWGIIMWVLNKPNLALFGSLAWAIHLIFDNIFNKTNKYSYFFTYRLKNKFKKECIFN